MFKGTMTKWPVQKLTQGTIQKLLQHQMQQTCRKHITSITQVYSLLILRYMSPLKSISKRTNHTN